MKMYWLEGFEVWILLIALKGTLGNNAIESKIFENSHLRSRTRDNWHSDTINPHYEPDIVSASDFYLKEILKQLRAINKKIDRAMIRLTGSTVKGEDNDENYSGKERSNFTKPDCESLINSDLPSGIYHFSTTRGSPWIWNIFEIYCDQSNGGGWTVIQRRGNNYERVNFRRSFDDYAKGFGDLNGEFWLGNEWIHRLTTFFGPYELRIELENSLGHKFWSQYSEFTVHSRKDNYRLNIDGYTGNYTDYSNLKNSTVFNTHDRRGGLANKPCTNFGGIWWYTDGCIGGNMNSDSYRNTRMMIRLKNLPTSNRSNDENME